MSISIDYGGQRLMASREWLKIFKGLKQMKKLCSFFLASVGGVATALAEDASTGAIAWENSVAKTIVENSSTTLTNFITGAGTVVAGVVVGGLAIWGGIALVGILKKAFSTGKGR